MPWHSSINVTRASSFYHQAGLWIAKLMHISRSKFKAKNTGRHTLFWKECCLLEIQKATELGLCAARTFWNHVAWCAMKLHTVQKKSLWCSMLSSAMHTEQKSLITPPDHPMHQHCKKRSLDVMVQHSRHDVKMSHKGQPQLSQVVKLGFLPSCIRTDVWVLLLLVDPRLLKKAALAFIKDH